MKKKLTITLITIATATALTACTNTPTPEETTRQIETQRYHDTITPRWNNPHEGWKTSYGTNPLTLEESINICEDLRVNLESAYLIQNADTEVTDRDQYLNYAGLIHDEMCELD